MEITRAARLWSEPPLALQIMLLLLGGLVVAQLVTLFLTLLLPPEPQPQYGLTDIAHALSGAMPEAKDARPLQRVVQSGPPALNGPGWLTSDRSRRDLARMLGRDEKDVQLYFFTPLPFAGIAGTLSHPHEMPPPPPGAPPGGFPGPPPEMESPAPAPQSAPEHHAETDRLPPGFMYADYQVAQAGPGTGAGNAFPGGAFPGGAIPGGGFPRGAIPGGGFPGGGIPRQLPQTTSPQTGSQTGSPTTAGHPSSQAPTTAPNANTPTGAVSRGPAAATVPNGASPNAAGNGLIHAPTIMPNVQTVSPLSGITNDGVPALPLPERPVAPPRAAAPVERPAPRPSVAPDAATHAPTVLTPAPAAAPQARPQSVAPAAPDAARPDDAAPIPFVMPERGLFGFAPAPFVEGDFVAALRLPDGAWAVVEPTPEPFPNAWQRRVLLWFLISFALVAPLGWLVARRVVRPITGFAYAAEQLGRDPTASVLALEGPSEVGRAAHAFNRMQSRLRSFVDDRTAMVGAISHDLRTPLTRLRFRIEDVPENLQPGMLAEVQEMEEMISSVLSFIRDASEPGSREKLDLRSIVEDVVEDAVFVGKSVTLEDSERAPVEVDALGMRRLLGNLVENAVKYGDRASVRLFTDRQDGRQDAVTEISDNGPGLPDDELERVFQPFYRAAAARASGKLGSGLGLAVCRSIARAHGGDVLLRRGAHGLVAQVRLPLAYDTVGA